MMTPKHSGTITDEATDRTTVLPSVAIVVVNWNGLRDTEQCLDALFHLDYVGHRVIVVDNGSLDGSASCLKAAYPWVTIIEAGVNRGFAGGCNLGMQTGLKRGVDYIWLLNNDAQAEPRALKSMVSVAEARQDIRFFGSWITQQGDSDRILFGGGTFSRVTGRIGNRRWNESVRLSRDVGCVESTSWISGCNLLVRASGLSSAALLDESFFLYTEELEWQLRDRKGRPQALIICSPLVCHAGGRSTGGTDSDLGRIFMSRNYIKLARRYATWAIPLWAVWWAENYVLRPALHLKFRRLLAGLRGLCLQNTDGAEIVARFWSARS